MNEIRKTYINNKFLVSSTKDANFVYIVNSEIGVYFYPVRMSGVPCKHQKAVAVKYHFLILNFILSLTLSNHIIYAYIALGK